MKTKTKKTTKGEATADKTSWNKLEVNVQQDGESMMLLYRARQTFTSGGMYCIKQIKADGRNCVYRIPLGSIRLVTELYPL